MNILESSADFFCIGYCSIVILRGQFNASWSLLALKILAGEIIIAWKRVIKRYYEDSNSSELSTSQNDPRYEDSNPKI